MKPLGWYLAKIAEQKAISKQAFLRQWKQAGESINFAQAVFTFGKQDCAVVTVKQMESFAQLRSRYSFSGDRTSRISAAIGGNSHSVSVDGSVVLTRNLAQPHPVVVVISHDSFIAPRELKPTALIIENLQNFLLLEETIAFAQLHTHIDDDQLEVIFGDGHAINNALHHDLLNEFDKTWWLMDADPGGFKIISNALSYLAPQKMEVLIPSDIRKRLRHHGKPLSSKGRDEIMALASRHSILQNMAEPVIELHRQLEQETYLLTRWEAPSNEL